MPPLVEWQVVARRVGAGVRRRGARRVRPGQRRRRRSREAHRRRCARGLRPGEIEDVNKGVELSTLVDPDGNVDPADRRIPRRVLTVAPLGASGRARTPAPPRWSAGSAGDATGTAARDLAEREALQRGVELARPQPQMSGTSPPLARAISRAASICAGALSRPKNCVAALPGMWLCRPFGAWVANTRPRPYLRACDASASVLCVQAVIASGRGEGLRLVHHEQPAERPVARRVLLDPGEQRHLQLVDEALPLLVRLAARPG